MKIILDNKFNIVDVEDTLDELLVKGSNRFDKLAVFIPTALKEQYESIYPTYAVKRADGRELGNYSMPSNDSSVDGCYGWSAPFNARVLAVEGALQITITFTLNDTVKKTVCSVTTNVRKALQVNDDVYVIGDGDNVISVMNAILEALGNEDIVKPFGLVDLGTTIETSGTLTETQLNKVKNYDYSAVKRNLDYFILFSADSVSKTYVNYKITKPTSFHIRIEKTLIIVALQTGAYTITTDYINSYTSLQIDDLLDDKADVSTTYTKTEVNNLLNNKVDKERLNQYIFNVDVNDEEEIENHDDFSLLFMSITDKENKDLSQFKVRLTFGAEHLDQTQNYYTYEMLELKEVSTEPNKVTYLFKNEDMKSVCYEVKIIQNGYNNETYSITYNMYDAPFPSSTEFNTLKGQVTGLDTRVGAIEGKIPAQASSSNQLADKSFVNSSIATATATYQGNLNLITDLNLALTATHTQVEAAIENYFHQQTLVTINENDYCYVSYPVSTTQTTTYSKVERYKVGSDSNWYYEYTLNNSGFTARQWAAINSGVTASEIADMKEDINDNAVDISYLQTDLSAVDTRVGTAEEKIDSAIEDIDVNSQEINENYARTNKSLYNLGSYDTISGNVITRQTGYAIFDGSDDEFWGTWDTDQFRIRIPGLIQAPGNMNSIVSNRYKQTANWGEQRAIGVFNADGSIEYSLFVRDNNYTLATFKESLRTNPLIVQYKLATSYTEDIIPNQPLLNLDQNGCNWVRSEWEKGLNLFDINSAKYETNNVTYSISGNSITITGQSSSQWDNLRVIWNVKPNTQYNLSLKNSYNQYVYIYDGSNGTAIRGDGNPTVTELNYTFTTPSNCYILWIQLYDSQKIGNTVSNIMLVEGSHAYPYQEYKGEIVHTSDIEPILLWENGSSSREFESQTITTANMSAYKYLIIKYTTADTNACVFKKVLNTINADYELDWSSFNVSGGDINCRAITIDSSTQISVFDNTSYHISSNTLTIDNDYCSPVAIYGTNIL